MVQFSTSSLIGAAAIFARFASAAPLSARGYDSGSGNMYGNSGNSNSYGMPMGDNSYPMGYNSNNGGDMKNGNNYDSMSSSTSSSMMYEATSSSMYEASSSTSSSAMYEATSSSTMMMEDTSTMTYATSTSSSWESMATEASTMMYGSGSSNWGGNSGYDNCVQQCMATFGAPAASYTPPPPTATSESSSGSGNGVTHTVIVAPTQGVLRYVPFATNASIGDTIHFVWGANNHTVTKSSSLELCNKTKDTPFTSGTQNKGFVFEQVVNDTNPVFYYCGTPTHCQKGMFGIINPPNALVASETSAASLIPSMVANDSNLAAMYAYSNNITAGNSKAANWGGSIDMGGMEPWAQTEALTNIFYARAVIATNPDIISDDGTWDFSKAVTFPQDLAAVMGSSSSTPAAPAPGAVNAGSDSGSSSTMSGSAPGSSPTALPSTSTSGARSLGASSLMAGVVAILAASFVL